MSLYYTDNNHILNYNNTNNKLTLNASFKRYDDIVFNLNLSEKEFNFQALKDYTIYNIYISNNKLIVTTLKDSNIKEITYINNPHIHKLSIKNTYLNNTNKDDYISIEKNNNTTILVTNNKIYKTKQPLSNNKINLLLKSLLELEENNIKEAFDIINKYIPNFFNLIKYNFSILNNFNNLYNTINIKILTNEIFFSKGKKN